METSIGLQSDLILMLFDYIRKNIENFILFLLIIKKSIY
jgi:hypothetical protein